MKKLLKRQLIIVLSLGFLIFLGIVSYFIFKNPIQSDAVSITANASSFYAQDKVNFELPVRLKIPQIKVDANVEYVGLTSAGAMDVPKGPAEAGWYMLGPKPGEIGNSVIAGHSGWRNKIPAIFDNLYKLKKGDKIYVENNIGVITTFVVRELRTYKPNADAFDVFVSNDGKAHLNLITCTGFWNKILKSHSDRLVVFTDRE